MVSQQNSQPTSSQDPTGWSDYSQTTDILVDELKGELYYGKPYRFCNCGYKAPRFTDWNGWSSPGRRYFACKDWTMEGGVRKHFCDFKEWFDPVFPSRTRRVINALKYQWKTKIGECDSYKEERCRMIEDRDEMLEDRAMQNVEMNEVKEDLQQRKAKIAHLNWTIQVQNDKLKRQRSLIKNLTYAAALTPILFWFLMASGMWIATNMTS